MIDFWVRRIMHALDTRTGMALLKWRQDRLLQGTVRHAARHSPFYRLKLAELGVSPRAIRALEDLPRLGFFTTPQDLQADPFDFLAVPRNKVVHMMATSGTTGKPKVILLTRWDWQLLVQKLYLGHIGVGPAPYDVAQVMMSSGTPAWAGGTLLQSSLARRGTFIVPVGNTLSPEAQIECIKRYGSTYLFSTPSYLHRVTEEGKKVADLRSLGVYRIYLGAEPNNRAFRDYLAEQWGAEVYEGYGMMEFGAGIAGECPERTGMHLDLMIAVEVVDPDSGRTLPEGQVGELVFTSLGRQATPLLRYRSGDLGRLLPNEPCPCRMLPTRKMDYVQGRCDDMIFLGTGENFHPASLDDALLGLEGVTGYQMVVGKEGYKDTLLLRIETVDPSADLAQRVKDRLYRHCASIRHDVVQSQTIAEPQVEFLSPGTLGGQNPVKVKKLIDRRRAP